MSNHTYSSIAADVGVNKRTVQDWWDKHRKRTEQELGQIDEAGGARLFTDNEREILLGYMSDRPKKAEQSIQPAVIVESGNHQVNLGAPGLPQVFTLEPLRQSEVVQFEDPLAIAHQFMQAADLVIAGMSQDVQARQQRLNETVEAKDAIAAKKQQLELEARLYQLQTGQIDAQTSRETQRLSDALQALQCLGKPPAAPSDSGQS